MPTTLVDNPSRIKDEEPSQVLAIPASIFVRRAATARVTTPTRMDMVVTHSPPSPPTIERRRMDNT